MSIHDILRSAPRSRHPRGARTSRIALVGLVAVAALAGCAPRQAIVESEPGRGAAPAPAGDEEVQATLRADLRMLADAQEDFRADNGYYAARTSDLGFTATTGVRLSIIQGDRNGWSAVAASTTTDDECAMYAGDIRSPRGYLTSPGTAMCR
ncbi:MAG TPA: hypothetical protein VLA33_12195 [Gemmatimonadota bacterium]|nr:hypothetical protein [Gemmatimonadota bacterium]